MVKVVGVKFRETGKSYYFAPGDLALKQGEKVIVESAGGMEMGTVSSAIKEVDESAIVPPLKCVVRKATQTDVERAEKNKAKEKEAFAICEEKIAKHKLEMRLVNVEYSFDASKILFYFTADGRVDFRELVRDLASHFKTRIELRQIGIRDEAKLLGGIGICGRSLCCGAFLDGFHPVSIKMAKEQGLSLNPTKISGNCGRLMCCLKYEQNCYEEFTKLMPTIGSVVMTEDGKGTVQNIKPVDGTVYVKLENFDTENPVVAYNAKDIKILKNARQVNQEENTAELKELEDN